MAQSYRPNVMAHPPFDAVADPRKYVVLVDHFIGGRSGDDAVDRMGELGWVITDVAGAADSDVDFFTTAATIKGHPGIISLNTGPTTPAAADEASMFLEHVDAIVLNDPTDGGDGDDEHVYLMAVVRFPSVASIEFNFGLFDALNAAGRGVNSVSVEFDDSADQEFNLVVVDGSTATAVATDVTVAADTWYTLEIAANEDEAILWINGVFKARTTSANIPDDEPLGVGFKVATETTAEKSVLIDTFALRMPVFNTGL